MDRRNFLKKASLMGLGLPLLAANPFSGVKLFASTSSEKPALLSGRKIPSIAPTAWPLFDQAEYTALAEVLESGKWGRLHGGKTYRFEKQFAAMQGAKAALALSSGTSALTTLLGVLDIGPGDEVIIPAYTFVATYNVVTLNHALPIFVDTDRESFQIDATKVEQAISPQTRLLMPVPIGGSPCDLDTLLEIAQRRGLPLVEDACQAHLAEWRSRGVGTFGVGGAFSFQSTKNLNCAEGGAIVSNDREFIRKCYCFHNQGRGINANAFLAGEGVRASNLRITEFQSAMLLAQMARVEEQTRLRNENAGYLTKLFQEIEGVTPAKLYEGTTRSAYHLYMFRYDANHFAGMSKEQFIKALNAEGVACNGGYGAMNRGAYVTELANNRHYLHIYGKRRMRRWVEENALPQNEALVKEAVWIPQTSLLGTRQQMEQIGEAILRVQRHAAELAKL